MQANWQCPFPTVAISLDGAQNSSPANTARKLAPYTRNVRRDRFDYWLIFAVSLLVIAWLGLIERCNPVFWLSHRDPTADSFWAKTKHGAHHYATMAFQG